MLTQNLVGCARGWRSLVPLLFLFALFAGCKQSERKLAPRSQTWAELRTVRQGVRVTPPGGDERAPYARERLVDGERVTLDAGALAWLRRDGGATLLVHGPAALTLYSDSIQVDSGRLFIDAPARAELSTPAGALHLSKVRSSILVTKDGKTSAYVLSGEVRSDGDTRAQPGERLTLAKGAAPNISPELVWEDWTGGLATTDRVAEPAPFGVGTVGARQPGSLGNARFPLAIQRLDVHVTIDGDFALTEVDQRFFNSSSQTVEGIYRFRSPPAASLSRFGVDRGDRLVWGRVKERAAAAAQYQQNVYVGSTEDPALLEWEAPGEYRARLYPIGPGETRRVVVRYTEWLGRSGPKAERRTYIYPMAAEGAEASLPHVEELSIAVDVGKAGAKEVRTGMAGVRKGGEIIVREHDFVPRADFTVELFDGGQENLVAYRAKHVPDLDVLPIAERAEARKSALGQADYVLVPVRARDVPQPEGGMDLAIVVDSSAANEPAAMELARATTGALLAHLGDDDRAVVWAGAEELRPVVSEMASLAKVDEAARRRVLSGLATLSRGGATDLGSMLSKAQASLDPKRRGAVVYIGDGRATVGELSLTALKKKLSKLPRPVRLFALGVGAEVEMGVLGGLAAGGFAQRVDSGYAAARAALSLLEVAERPALLATAVDLGPSVERVYPRDPDALVSDETVLVVGRTDKSGLPKSLTLRGPAGEKSVKLDSVDLVDHGDLRRRWAEQRLSELLADGSGRAALVDLGSRFGIITPVTSLYVPTTRELAAERRASMTDDEIETEEITEEDSDNKEGGTGTRAKGEEGSMGRPTSSSNKRYAVQGPADNPDPHMARQDALKQAQEFGSIGLLNSGAAGDPNAPTAPWGRDQAKGGDVAAAEAKATGNMWGDEIGEAYAAGAPAPSATTVLPAAPPAEVNGKSYGAGGLGLSGIGEGGGGRGEGIGLGDIGTLGHGAGTGTGQGFGSGHGRLGGSHRTAAPKVRMGAVNVSGRLPPEVIQRIVRQNYGRFRLCYEQGLARNPNLEGRVSTRFVIGRDGSVANASNAGSDIPDQAVTSCVVNAMHGLSFPQPEGGIVTVVYPIMLSPGEGGGGAEEPQAEAQPASVVVKVDGLPRFVWGCSSAANVPLGERIGLWRERLARASGSPGTVAEVYRNALRNCEAPSWRERRRLLSLLLDALPTVTKRVELWRILFSDRGAADVLYRGIVARVKKPAEMRELHQALGLKSMDAGLLAKYIKDAKTPSARVDKLRALFSEWPDDFSVALALLDALEDAKDRGGARDLAERLRARPDLDAHVRTAIGELYLRLAASDASKADKQADTAAARRAFGEIVEFSPDDPVARRRLGDLLRSHGWYVEAERQYQTLAQLSPEDPTVPLLLGAAAQGQGQLEAAVRWIEKTAESGPPTAGAGQSPSSVAHALSATYLAWGRLAAKAGKRDKELQALIARATRVLADDRAAGASKDTVRVSLTWSHPELHPTLWSDALGSPMPAPEGDVALGISQVRLPKARRSQVEVKVEPDEVERAARLGAEAVLTVVFDELGKSEKIVKLPLRFERGGPAVLKLTVAAGEVSRD